MGPGCSTMWYDVSKEYPKGSARCRWDTFTLIEQFDEFNEFPGGKQFLFLYLFSILPCLIGGNGNANDFKPFQGYPGCHFWWFHSSADPETVVVCATGAASDSRQGSVIILILPQLDGGQGVHRDFRIQSLQYTRIDTEDTQKPRLLLGNSSANGEFSMVVGNVWTFLGMLSQQWCTFEDNAIQQTLGISAERGNGGARSLSLSSSLSLHVYIHI